MKLPLLYKNIPDFCLPFTTTKEPSKTDYNCQKFTNVFFQDPVTLWAALVGPGYEVDRASWDTFMAFITSREQLNALDTSILLEFCHSLDLQICQEQNRELILTELVKYFQENEPSLRLYPTWIPQSFMTVYCSNPQVHCKL